MKAHIVVGLGYGDEGKGVTTNYLCSLANPIVIRFNGGQQAGHTVVVDGKKHICSNFGAGVLKDVPVYYTEHTTFYPVSVMNELDRLKDLDEGISPRIFLHPLTKITTPLDVIANRTDYDNCNHGTCGLGVGKTMKRNEENYKLHAIDLFREGVFSRKLDSITYYYNEVANECNYEDMEEEFEKFFEAVKLIKEFVTITDYTYLKRFNNLIFEGAQGILLDMDHGAFPNVTYSNTTSKNAIEVADKLNIFHREIYYVTRCYSTRHGGGLFNAKKIDLVNNEEETNIHNKWQGFFRTGEINYDLLNYALEVDNIYSSNINNDKCAIHKNIVVTCLDQRPDFVFDYNKLPKFYKKYEFRSASGEQREIEILTRF